MYAIVRSGGQQHRVAVGDVLTVDRVDAGLGAAVSLPVVLLVDDGRPTTDRSALAGVTVTAEVLEHTKGPKVVIHKFRNKTGYHQRMGHRQRQTRLKVTGIETGKQV